jgi:hypothetical protein
MPRDHADLTMPLPPVDDTPGGRHGRRRPTAGWGIAVMAMVTVPIGLGLGWFGPSLLGGEPPTGPHSRYEPDIPQYPTTTPHPPTASHRQQRLPAPAARDTPKTTPGTASQRRHTAPSRHTPTGTPRPPAWPVITPAPDPFTTTPTPTDTDLIPALRAPIHLTVESTPMTTPPTSDPTRHIIDDLKERVTSPAWTGVTREETLLLIAEITRLQGAVVSAHAQLLEGPHGDAVAILEAVLPPADAEGRAAS